MLSGTRGRILIGLLAVTLAIAVVAALASKPPAAIAQVPPALNDEPIEMRPPPGEMPPGPMRPGMAPPPSERWGMPPSMMRPGMMGGNCVAIAATQNYVYVVMDRMVYQLRADNLKEVNKAELLPAQMMPPSPPRPGVVPRAP